MSLLGAVGPDQATTRWGKWLVVATIRVVHGIHAFSAMKGTILNTFIPNHGKTAILWTFSESKNHTLTSNWTTVFVDHGEVMLVRSMMLITCLGGPRLKCRTLSQGRLLLRLWDLGVTEDWGAQMRIKVKRPTIKHYSTLIIVHNDIP